MPRKYLSRYRPNYSGAYRGRRPLRKQSSRQPRRYGRKRRGGRSMTKKRILNVSSTKKRDDMASYYTAFDSTGKMVAGVGPFTASGNATGASAANARTTGAIWCATARDFTASSAGPRGSVQDIATRTSTTCYVRGVSERIEIQTSSGAPWQWRRICFKYRGQLFGSAQVPSQSGNYATHVETSNGYQRLVLSFTDASATSNTVENSLTNLIFRGTPGTGDWYDYMTAPLDPTRIDVAYDKFTTISSGNTSGKVFRKKIWHSMNKNLVYDDDESGGTETSYPYSMHGKQGMGDYYIVDFFRAGIGATATDQLSFNPQSTLYWHEK
uniref:Capsid protein n=1 Tax=Ficedula parva Genomoviridae sp. TaxID=2814952 RepID=A0A8E7L5X7_9VIRU|nr:MAG: capsid protein [Gemycircularvirus]